MSKEETAALKRLILIAQGDAGHSRLIAARVLGIGLSDFEPLKRVLQVIR